MRPWEAGFGSESDWEKLWRDQVSGAKMTETNRNSARACRQQTLSLLDAARTHASLEPQPIALLRRSTNLQATDAATAPCCSNTCISGTASYSNIRTPLAVAHNVAVVLPEALTEPEAGVGTESVTMGGSEGRFGADLDWKKLWRDQVSGAKRTETNRNKLFFSRDSEAAFGTQCATMGGSFWSRIRLGKAVAGPGVRGQEDRDK